MKKTLLTALFAFSAVFGGMAEETMTFAYSGDVITGLGTSRKTYYSVAFEMPAAFCEANKGAKITSVAVGFGRGVNKECEVFVTKELGQTPLSTGKTTSLKEGAYNTISLDSPVELAGETLYIGYTYNSTSAADVPIAFDQQPNSYIYIADYASVTPDPNKLWSDEEFGQFGSTYGNPCIQAVLVKDDAFAPNTAMPKYISLPEIIRPWTEFEFTVAMQNMGTNPINSVEVEYKLGGAGVKAVTYNFETPVAPGEIGEAKFTGRNDQDGEVNLLARSCVSKVNGVDNPLALPDVRTTFSPSSRLFERRMVLEEYTGIGCGFCPRGWYGIEEFSKQVNDGSFIAIGVHNYGSGGDPMFTSAYNQWANQWITGAPQGTVNRLKGDFQQFNPGLDEIAEAYGIIHSVCKQDVQISAEFEDEEQNNVVATAYVTMAEDMDKHNYGLAYVITQDEIGPYTQSNYYAGGRYGEMGGFENLPAATPLMFNDVARDIYNWNGDRTALPTSFVAGETYTNEKKMSLTRCKTLANASLDNVNVIVLLIDRSSGEILNAAKCRIGGASESSVEEVAEKDAYKVRAMQGRIAVDGEYDSVAVYTADGGAAGVFSAGQAINVPAGLYLVSVDGGKAVKVIVR